MLLSSLHEILFFVLIIIFFFIFILGCLEVLMEILTQGTKATLKPPLYVVTAKNKAYKDGTFLHYDFFSSHGP